VGFNSKFMVVAPRIIRCSRNVLKIYGPEVVKNPKSTEDGLLVRTEAVEFEINGIEPMDETLLIWAGQHKTHFLDIGSLSISEKKRNLGHSASDPHKSGAQKN
jgi:hypothetical protein